MADSPKSIPILRSAAQAAALAVLFAVLWFLRSWNLDIGDGEFCCKQTVGEAAFPTTMSRSFLSYALYRAMFFSLHPILNWWVEDIIALSSCAAGIVFFAALFRLADHAAPSRLHWWLIVLFPSSSLVLQVFCGHIEFYPWLCASLMVSAYFAWRCLAYGESPVWASAAMALAAGFHSSGVFYFPALLALPALMRSGAIERGDWARMAGFLALYLATAMLHRESMLYLAVIVVAVPLYFISVPLAIRQRLAPWMTVYLPWFFLFTLRASLGLKAEPLLEHIAPLGEPYDHGAYLYTFFSIDHLYDKAMFHLWLAPLGLPVLLYALIAKRKETLATPWLHYLLHFCVWAMVWSIIFYPQLRTRDWDLFASMSVPLNLFALFFLWSAAPRKLFTGVITAAVIAHFCISIPVIVRNASLFEHRGYVTLDYRSEPAPAKAYIRGLMLGVTPVIQANIRSGPADVRMISTERGYGSWSEELLLENGETYIIDQTLPESAFPAPPPE